MADVYTIHKISVSKNKQSKYKPYLRILSSRHPRLKKLIKKIGTIKKEIPIWNSVHDAVLYAVIGQMLSVSASNSIISRLLKKYQSSANIFTGEKKPL